MVVCGEPLLEAASSGQYSSDAEIALYESGEGDIGTTNVDRFSLGAMASTNSLKVGIDAEKTRRIS